MSRFKPQVLLLQRSGNVHSLYSGSIDQPAESDKIAHGSKAQEGDVSLRMRWFRDHIRQGSWLALVAIAINFAVAFGHVHALDGTASERGPAALLASTTSSDGDQTQNHPADRTDYLCPICMAAAAMGTALAPTPPALPVEFADVAIDRTIEHTIAAPHPPRAAFQSRGPPLS